MGVYQIKVTEHDSYSTDTVTTIITVGVYDFCDSAQISLSNRDASYEYRAGEEALEVDLA